MDRFIIRDVEPSRPPAKEITPYHVTSFSAYRYHSRSKSFSIVSSPLLLFLSRNHHPPSRNRYRNGKRKKFFVFYFIVALVCGVLCFLILVE
ncbi:hypothetical protein EX30DRAFT_79713 [Ascodesmis nigricans]|uniref:Transmembrane protein n=1 Tax=Ascodesmis nigricans TaxID=341454 RepID=A0A4S2MT05_9PEZI|nr:hypothetical protein EX30DRAFT_79713 [Ascodesmis nigricans]